jgi:hypothetical protein
MNRPERDSLRDEVIARLMTRHGLTFEEAASAWEQYQLRLFARHVCQPLDRDVIEGN